MKNKIIEITLILGGIILIAYPVISMCVASYNQTIAISNYQENVSSLSKEEKEEELKNAREYNDELNQSTAIDISMAVDEESEHVSYFNILNVGDVMAYISIPKINVYLPIYHGLSENVLQSGVGHLETTALPVGGKGTHCVLAGHTGLVRTKIFDDINKLEIGDKFYLNVLDEKLVYEVDKIDVVLPDNTEAIVVDELEDYVTLITCTPYMVNTHRLLVRGSRTEENEAEEGEVEEANIEIIKSSRKKYILIVVISFIIVTIILIKYIFNEKKNSHRKRRKGSHYDIKE